MNKFLCLVVCIYGARCGQLEQTDNSTINTYVNTTEAYTNLTTAEPSETNVTNETTTEVFTEASTTSYPETFIPHKTDFCTCDLSVDYCDINCCCDKDCTSAHYQLFDGCAVTYSHKKGHLCTSRKIIFANNTRYILNRTSSGMFCVLWDNVGEKSLYNEVKAVRSVKDLQDLEVRTTYGWKLDGRVKSEASSRKKLRFGDPIFMGNCPPVAFRQWILPWSSGLSAGFCDANKPVVFLHDFKTTCRRSLRDINENCVSNSKMSATSYLHTLLFNSNTNLNALNEDNIFLHQIEQSRCVTYCSGCVSIDIEDNYILHPTLAKNADGSAVCRGVVQSVHYIVLYEASKGVTNVTVKFDYANITQGDTLEQYYRVSFIENGLTDVVKRSGNPGYIVGNPVLAINAQDMPPKSQPFVIPKIDGNCNTDHNRSQEVLFGVNAHNTCAFSATLAKANACKVLQELIFQVIPQHDLNAINVGIFGSSNASNSADWIPVLKTDDLTLSHTAPLSKYLVCPSIITGYTVDFFYAKSGVMENAQLKIVSVLKTYTKPTEVAVSCVSNKCTTSPQMRIEVSVSVNFKDLSGETYTVSPPTPLLRIRLPSDFFYPFLTDGARSPYVSLTHSFVLIFFVTLIPKYLLNS